jgi:toxin ParE1/3/4
VNYRLHPEAALEHEEQVTYYEERRRGLGQRYHAAMLRAVGKACRAPHRFRVVGAPDLRRVSLQGFPLAVIFREVAGIVQVLAIAHHRREPNYWRKRA